MSSLERTKQGIFRIEKSTSLEDVESNDYRLLKVSDIFDYPVIDLNEEDYFKAINGNKIVLDNQKEKVILTYNNEDIAIYKKEDDYYKCYVMLKHQ